MGLHSNYAEEFQSESDLMYPAENLIRIFKGSYPDLDLPKKEFSDSSIIDVGCGDGRHVVFLSSDLGFDTYGVEPTEELAQIAQSNVDAAGADASVHAGTNRNLPFDDAEFDYLLSWNSSYYMGEGHDFDFDAHVEEYARVLKEGGRIVLSVPKPSSFIFEGSESAQAGYEIIRNDPFGIRNGSVLRRFTSLEEVKDTFKPEFANFTTASVQTDFFGYNYHWWLLVGDYVGDA